MLHQAWKMVLNNLTKFFWLPTAAVFFSSFEEEVQARQFLSYSLLDFFFCESELSLTFFWSNNSGLLKRGTWEHGREASKKEKVTQFSKCSNP